MEVVFVVEIAGYIFEHTQTFESPAEVRKYARQLAKKVNGKVYNAYALHGDKIPLEPHCPARS